MRTARVVRAYMSRLSPEFARHWPARPSATIFDKGVNNVPLEALNARDLSQDRRPGRQIRRLALDVPGVGAADPPLGAERPLLPLLRHLAAHRQHQHDDR